MNKFARLSLFAAAAIALTACGNKEEQPAGDASAAAEASAGAETVVKIGQVSPMTGPIAHLGKDNEFGAKLAIEDLNAEGVEIAARKSSSSWFPKMTRLTRKSVPRLHSVWLTLV